MNDRSWASVGNEALKKGRRLLFAHELSLKPSGSIALVTDDIMSKFPPTASHPQLRTAGYWATGRLRRLSFVWEVTKTETLDELIEFLTQDRHVVDQCESYVQRLLEPTKDDPVRPTAGRNDIRLRNEIIVTDNNLEKFLTAASNFFPQFVKLTGFELAAAGSMIASTQPATRGNQILHFWNLRDANQLPEAMDALKEVAAYAKIQALVSTEKQQLLRKLGRDIRLAEAPSSRESDA